MSGRARIRSADETARSRFSALISDVEALGQNLSADEIPEALGQLERVRSRLLPRLALLKSATAEEDRLLKVEAAADLLDMSPDTLYRKAREFPFTVLLPGRQVRFSALGIQRYIRARQGRP
jgi:predicted DNA-binding transcriptional regulator AlpA